MKCSSNCPTDMVCCARSCEGNYGCAMKGGPGWGCPLLSCDDRAPVGTGLSTCTLPEPPPPAPAGDYLVFESNYDYISGDFQNRGRRCYYLGENARFVDCSIINAVENKQEPQCTVMVSPLRNNSRTKITVTRLTDNKTIDIATDDTNVICSTSADCTYGTCTSNGRCTEGPVINIPVRYRALTPPSVTVACTHVLSRIYPFFQVTQADADGALVRYALNWSTRKAKATVLTQDVPLQGSAGGEESIDPLNSNRAAYIVKPSTGHGTPPVDVSNLALWTLSGNRRITALPSGTTERHMIYAPLQFLHGTPIGGGTGGQGPGTGGAECVRDDDCALGSVCRSGQCVSGCCADADCIGFCNANKECVLRGCRSAADCPGGRCDSQGGGIRQCSPEKSLSVDRCVGHACLQPDTARSCRKDADCSEGYCVRGKCSPACRSDGDCGAGALCLRKACVRGACRADSDCPEGRCNEAGACELECTEDGPVGEPVLDLGLGPIARCGNGVCSGNEWLTCPRDCIPQCAGGASCVHGRCGATTRDDGGGEDDSGGNGNGGGSGNGDGDSSTDLYGAYLSAKEEKTQASAHLAEVKGEAKQERTAAIEQAKNTYLAALEEAKDQYTVDRTAAKETYSAAKTEAQEQYVSAKEDAEQEYKDAVQALADAQAAYKACRDEGGSVEDCATEREAATEAKEAKADALATLKSVRAEAKTQYTTTVASTKEAYTAALAEARTAYADRKQEAKDAALEERAAAQAAYDEAVQEATDAYQEAKAAYDEAKAAYNAARGG
ncbi:MAG: hypothetical protein V1926_01130 [Candidatus Peregrinibacteria bacterium]